MSFILDEKYKKILCLTAVLQKRWVRASMTVKCQIQALCI